VISRDYRWVQYAAGTAPLISSEVQNRNSDTATEVLEKSSVLQKTMEWMKESLPDINFEHRSENLPDDDTNKTLSQALSLPGTFPNEDFTVRSEEAENGYGSEPQAPRREKVIFDPEFSPIN
jgi:hypothetical protein